MGMTICNVALAALGAVCLLGLAWFWRPRSEPGENQLDCPQGGSRQDQTGEPHSKSGVVTVIKLTDDGEFVNRCDLTDATFEIRNCTERPVLAVWYIHGWKHTADDDDSDLKNFEKLIQELNARQPRGKDGHHVVGVYVGWDGAVGLRLPLLQELTFWNRKAAADRISQSAVLAKAFAAVRYARRQNAPQHAARDLTVFIGHSFGARILHTATCQVLIDEVQRQHPGKEKGSYGVMTGPADLIVLLNPALEASTFTAIHTVSRPEKWWERIHDNQPPLLLAISSERDLATRLAFPLGKRLASAFSERQVFTLGNYDPYVTHRLQTDRRSIEERAVSSTKKPKFWYDQFESGRLQLLLRVSHLGPDEPKSWLDRIERALLALLLVQRHKPKNGKKQSEEFVIPQGNPFIVARAASNVIGTHNDIWRPELRDWMIAFLLELLARRKSRVLTARDA